MKVRVKGSGEIVIFPDNTLLDECMYEKIVEEKKEETKKTTKK